MIKKKCFSGETTLRVWLVFSDGMSMISFYWNYASVFQAAIMTARKILQDMAREHCT